jgi:8-oxo-dGTP diphosphatase
VGEGGRQEAAVLDAVKEPSVRASGGVVWRPGRGGLEVVLVHRPAYDDWSLPKGKPLPGEDDLACAMREVEEETGLKPEVGPELPSTEYRDRNGRPKLVRYWAMRSNGGRLAPTEEIDRAVWKDLASAREALTYDRDRVVLDARAGVLPEQ